MSRGSKPGNHFVNTRRVASESKSGQSATVPEWQGDSRLRKSVLAVGEVHAWILRDQGALGQQRN